jgi:hypothetical protein
MKNSTWLSIAVLISALNAQAQSLKVYSEFQRIGPQGEIVHIDRGGGSREILSPAVARNAYASYHLLAMVPPRSEYSIYIGQNPDNAVRVSLYREIHERGIPDRLEPVAEPVTGKTGTRPEAVVLWLDLWVDREAPVRRIKVEPQLGIGADWIVYPMEVRVVPARIPQHSSDPAALPPSSSRSDSFVYGAFSNFLCGIAEGPSKPQPLTVRSLIRRNVLQDMALAKALNGSQKEAVLSGLVGPTGVPTRDAFCSAVTISTPHNPNTEWYLRVRDFLYRTAIN